MFGVERDDDAVGVEVTHPARVWAARAAARMWKISGRRRLRVRCAEQVAESIGCLVIAGMGGRLGEIGGFGVGVNLLGGWCVQRMADGCVSAMME